jgi:hypothetical protein
MPLLANASASVCVKDPKGIRLDFMLDGTSLAGNQNLRPWLTQYGRSASILPEILTSETTNVNSCENVVSIKSCCVPEILRMTQPLPASRS